jgi:hypothetical protein
VHVEQRGYCGNNDLERYKRQSPQCLSTINNTPTTSAQRAKPSLPRYLSPYSIFCSNTSYFQPTPKQYVFCCNYETAPIYRPAVSFSKAGDLIHVSTERIPRQAPAFDAPHVLIVGAGVIGLTTAWTLLDHGYKVTVLAENFATRDGKRLTSQIAGAL